LVSHYFIVTNYLQCVNFKIHIDFVNSITIQTSRLQMAQMLTPPTIDAAQQCVWNTCLQWVKKSISFYAYGILQIEQITSYLSS
jgi:hypothetical protein